MTGERVGNWLLGAELGRGPMGVVYAARNADDRERTAAVKVLTHDATRTKPFLDSFPANLLFLHRLNHPNIVKFYEAGVHNGAAWYASELVEGQDCATLLKTRSRKPGEPGLPWAEEVVPLAVQAARAIKHAHHRSILHRDLKPGNFLIAKDGSLKIADFGIAKVFDLAPLALPADPFGTAGFLAPEHFTGKPLTRRSDLYALGGVLYAVTAGRPPFAAGSAAEFLHKHCYMLPDRPAQFVGDLPGDLDDLICELLSKDPGRRPATAAAVLEALDQLRGKLERKGKKVSWPADPGDASGPMPALPDTGDDGDAEPATARPIMSRPIVVVPGFLVFLAIVLAVIFWPRPSAEELYARAEPLMKSDQPADWDKALDDYLDPLSSRYPDWQPKQVEADRTRLRDRKELRRAVEQSAKADYDSEAERLYHQGRKLAESGNPSSARRVWASVVEAFDGIPAEERWVALARQGLEDLVRKPPTKFAYKGLDAALAHVASLKESGKGVEAAKALEALADLYRDDPDALAIIRAAQ